MKVFSDTFPADSLSAFEQHFIRENMLFVDIETTGLSPVRDQIYCIGCGYRKKDRICTDLFFAENSEDEPSILKAFFRLLSGFDTIVTFNGTAFDLPFIRKRAELHQISLTHPFPAAGLLNPETAPDSGAGHTVDLYRETTRLKKLLGLSSCRQKCVEQFLGCCRDDTYSGGELIEVYQNYVLQKDPGQLQLLLLHNLEDVKGMFSLTGILSYRQLREGQFQISDSIRETEGGKAYLNLKIIPAFDFPQSIHRIAEDSSFLLNRSAGLIRLPLRHGTLKHFFPDPENYYYLPTEDTAIHKSVGEFVDPSHRKKATKKNCYIKKDCDYVETPSKTAGGFLKKEYNEKTAYLEIPNSSCAGHADACREFLQLYFAQFIS